MRCRALVVALLLVSFAAIQPVWAGNVVIKGSTTVLPIAQKVSEAYMAENPEVRISISGGGSGNGIKALIDGMTDIADSSRFIKDKEVKQAVENGQYPVPFAVAYDCIVPAVHPSNTASEPHYGPVEGDLPGTDQKLERAGRPGQEDRGHFPGHLVRHLRGVGEDRDAEGKGLPGCAPAGVQRCRRAGRLEEQERNRLYRHRIYQRNREAPDGGRCKGNSGDNPERNVPDQPAPLHVHRGWPTGDTLNFINYVLHPAKGQKLVGEVGFVPLY